ncbi:MAG TPA: glycoside hydrolase family 15 protein [Terriglobales bacterium]|nr:glycoside hydrolase family 15 protein [Terriglobales bacterium]
MPHASSHFVLPLTGQFPKIQDYGVIGDCRSAALVSNRGAIDWLCWPRFDSPSIFARILDRDRGGYWSIRPSGSFTVKRWYVQDSNVLETEFLCKAGRATLTDLMPVSSEEFKCTTLLPDHELVREVRCSEGECEVEIDFYPRAQYGLKSMRMQSLGNFGVRMDVNRGAYWLRSSIPLHLGEERATARVVLKQGDVLQYSLTYAEESPAVLPALGENTRAAIERSVKWWQNWAAMSCYRGPYRDAVTRSALALKLLAYAPSGAIAAAPTTSLPERIGDSLNWDYRYCWLRDSSLTVRALVGLGYVAEAEAFLTWLLHATRLTQPELCVLYTVFGEIASHECQVNRLSGYMDSRPVRIGNAARKQVQMDIYGEVIDAAAQYAQHVEGFDRTTQKVLIGLGKYVAGHWDRPDEGIWEPRSGPQNHTHSRLLCWTALDRLLAMNEKGIVPGIPRESFTRERDRIREQIETRAWNEQLHSYVATLDSNDMDATLLRLPWYGFEQAQSERMHSTYRKIREALGAGDSLLYRYERDPQEGAFGVCCFWQVEHVALGGGSLDEAHHMFEQLLTYGNDLGLFAEEIEPGSGDALGNFPQAFSHVGLISAALTLEEQKRGKAHPAVKVGSDVAASKREARV